MPRPRGPSRAEFDALEAKVNALELKVDANRAFSDAMDAELDTRVTALEQSGIPSPTPGIGTRDELLSALADASAGDTVTLAASASIDLGGLDPIVIPGGVTLQGQGSAHVWSHELDTFPLFRTGGDSVTVVGLRIEGPDKETGPPGSTYATPNSRGVQVDHDGFEASGCELWGWTHAAFLMRAGVSRLHHNDIHHCQRVGLGYGVAVDACHVYIEDSTFDLCRHAIASTGAPGSRYEARRNVFKGTTHSTLDMHPPGGQYIRVIDNDFHDLVGSAVIHIGAATAEVSEISGNRFARSTLVIRQFYPDSLWGPPNNPGWVNLNVYDNEYGWTP